MKTFRCWALGLVIIGGVGFIMFALRIVVTPHGQFHHIGDLPIYASGLAAIPVREVGHWRKGDVLGHCLQISGKVDVKQLLNLCKTNRALRASVVISAGPTKKTVIGPNGIGIRRIIAAPKVPVWYIEGYDHFVHLTLAVNAQTGEYSGVIFRTWKPVTIHPGVELPDGDQLPPEQSVAIVDSYQLTEKRTQDETNQE